MSFASNMVSTFRNNLALRKKVVFDPYRNKDAEIKAEGKLDIKPLSPDLCAQIKSKAKREDNSKQRKSMIVLAVVLAAVLWFFTSFIF
jgi:hypothetical protein